MIEPYWKSSDGRHVIYNADCLQVLPELETGSVDAVVTDPPYGMNFNTDSKRFSGFNRNGMPPGGIGRADRKVHGDDIQFDPFSWLMFKKVIFWGSNHYAAKLPTGTTLVWLKRSPQHYGTFLSDAEIGWQSGGKGVYVFFAEDSNARRRLEANGSVFSSDTAHPTQKPVALMKWCVDRIGDGTGTILDPFMGSGTTGVACVRTNRRFIGIEIEKRYCEISRKRMERELSQPMLPFAATEEKAEQATMFDETEDES